MMIYAVLSLAVLGGLFGVILGGPLNGNLPWKQIHVLTL